MGRCQLILGAREGWKQACRASAVFQKGGLGHNEHRAGQGSQYQVVVSAEGSPEFSSECIPDVNRVLAAAAGHTERDTDAQTWLRLSEGSQVPSPLNFCQEDALSTFSHPPSSPS